LPTANECTKRKREQRKRKNGFLELLKGDAHLVQGAKRRGVGRSTTGLFQRGCGQTKGRDVNKRIAKKKSRDLSRTRKKGFLGIRKRGGCHGT